MPMYRIVALGTDVEEDEQVLDIRAESAREAAEKVLNAALRGMTQEDAVATDICD